jgi:hypothetical protein
LIRILFRELPLIENAPIKAPFQHRAALVPAHPHTLLPPIAAPIFHPGVRDCCNG